MPRCDEKQLHTLLFLFAGCRTLLLQGALAEAAVMIGMERNSEVVRMAAYAPLLVNEHDHWYWTNLIGFNGTQ